MVATSNYLSNATKQQTQAHIDAMSSLLEHALHSTGEVAELGLTAAKESLNDSFAKFSEVIDSKDPAKVFEAFTLEVQPASEKVSAYAKHFVEIGTNAQNEVVKLFQERLDETLGHVNTLIDDLAKAVLVCLEKYDNPQQINIGSGIEVSIKDLAKKVSIQVGFKGRIIWDSSRPDGTPRKLLDSTKITNLGWKPLISLDQGIKATIEWYLENSK